MSKAEEFIQENTRNCSNIIIHRTQHGDVDAVHQPWLTPDQALKAVEIAREETIKDVYEWLYSHNDYICGSTNGIARYDMDKLIEDLQKHFEGKV